MKTRGHLARSNDILGCHIFVGCQGHGEGSGQGCCQKNILQRIGPSPVQSRIIQPKLSIVLRLKNAARSHPISSSPHYQPVAKRCQFPVQASISGKTGGTKCFFQLYPYHLCRCFKKSTNVDLLLMFLCITCCRAIQYRYLLLSFWGFCFCFFFNFSALFTNY